jgi:hypothetical protein
VFASVTHDYFNMGLGDSLDDEGIFVVLDTNQVNAVTALIPGRKMQIMTTGGEHVFTEEPVTPATSFAPQQTDYGSLPVEPALLEGSVIFPHARGKQLMEMSFSWQQDAFTTGSISLLSQHIIQQPVQLAAQKGTSLDAANYLYVVNNDGTIANLLTSKSQEIAAWSKWTTDGSFRSVCVIEDETYVLVERVIDGSTVFYLEQLATNIYTDAAATGTNSPASVTVTGLSHLEGKDVKVRADDEVLLPTETVVSGSITTAQASTTYEVGLNYTAIVETMPPNINLGDGSSIAAESRFTWIRLLVDNTRGLQVNGQIIPDRQTDVDPLDTTPPARTGIVEARPASNNWQRLPTITITQSDPHPMTVLALISRVEANQI